MRATMILYTCAAQKLICFSKAHSGFNPVCTEFNWKWSSAANMHSAIEDLNEVKGEVNSYYLQAGRLWG